MRGRVQLFTAVLLLVAGIFPHALKGADMSVQLTTNDGSSKFSIVNSSGTEVVSFDSLGRAFFSGIQNSSITILGNVFNGPSQLVQLTVAGELPAVSGSLLTNLSASSLTGQIANTQLDVSSVTLQGNAFNISNGLVKLDASGRLPAIDASQLTNVVTTTIGGAINSNQINPGPLPVGVIASSIAVNAVQDSAIVGLTASKLVGVIPNTSIDTSSVTKLGNVFNTANHLVQTDSGNRLPALDASLLTGIAASTLSGTINPSQINSGSLPATVIASSVATNAVQDSSIVGLTASKLIGAIPSSTIDTSSITKLGNTFNTANHLVQTDNSNRLPALDASLLTGIAASTLSGNINPSQLNAGLLPSTVIVASIAVNAVQDASIVGLTASKLTGTINNAAIDDSSITKVGNTFNTASHLVQTDTSNRLPALDASLLTGVVASTFGGSINPSQLNAGSLPATVIVSSIAVNAVQDASVVGLTASKLSGTISDAAIDGSSITKVGNTFNTASHLVQTDASNRLPALDASLLTGVAASTLSGNINPTQLNAGLLPSTVIVSSVAVNAVQDASIIGLTASKLTGTILNSAIDASSITKVGNTFNSASHLVQTDSSNRLPALDASLLTGVAASTLSGNINPTQLNAGTLPTTVIVSSVAVNAVQDASIVGLTASKLIGTISNSSIDGSSITKVGNTFNTASHLVQTDSSNRLPALDASLLTGVAASTLSGNISPTQLNAGSLPSTVIVSSVAVGAVQDASIVGLTASKLTGTISNAAIDTSSITKVGNTFNTASHLVQTDASNRLPALDASLLTGVAAATLGGNINPSQLNSGSLPSTVIVSSVAVNAVQDASIVGLTASKLTGTISNATIDTSSITKVGNTFNTASHLVQTDASNRLPALDASLLTGVAASTLGGNINPSQLNSGSLPSTVIVSSVAVNAVQDASIVGLTASKLTGTISNSAIDSSSVTKVGNTFNTASHLVQTDASNRLPALDASLLTGVAASTLNGNINPSQLNAGSLPVTVLASSVAVNAVQDASIVGLTATKLTGTINAARLDSSSATLQGNAFNVANGLTKLDGSGNLLLPTGASINIGGLRGSLVPSGTIIMSTSTCPTGFAEFIGARGFYLAGVPSGGTTGGTVGSAMTDLANPTHNHTVTAATNTATLTLGIGLTSLVTGVTSATNGVDRGTVAPYFQIRLCVVP